MHLERVRAQRIHQDAPGLFQRERRRLELALLMVRRAQPDQVLPHLGRVGAERLLVDLAW